MHILRFAPASFASLRLTLYHSDLPLSSGQVSLFVIIPAPDSPPQPPPHLPQLPHHRHSQHPEPVSPIVGGFAPPGAQYPTSPSPDHRHSQTPHCSYLPVP